MPLNWPLRSVVQIAVVLVAGVSLLGCDRAVPSPQQIEAATRAGDVIVRSIERYRADHGTLPSTLDDLVPTYLPRLSAVRAFGRQWDYHRDHSGSPFFQLSVSTFPTRVWGLGPTPYVALRYEYETRSWHVIEDSVP